MGTIYKITNKITGHAYIGFSEDVKRRWADHRAEARLGNSGPLYHAIRTYGLENFTWDVLYAGEDARDKERDFIVEHGGLKGYNRSLAKARGLRPAPKPTKILRKYRNDPFAGLSRVKRLALQKRFLGRRISAFKSPQLAQG